MTGPYGAAAENYWQAGWRGILPLPARKKQNPPSGYTGEGGVDPSFADVYSWVTGPQAAGNIALRMPRNVIGLDVDAYGDKFGRETTEAAERQWGPLPATWRTTSRDDGVSGIRLYRVPEGLAWPGELGAGTEIIQSRHRYAVVCPSLHPEGRTYRWINPSGVVSTAIPDPDELPSLPDAWVEGLTRGELATQTSRNNFTSNQTAEWLITLPGTMEPPCSRMRKAVDQMGSDLRGSAHNAGRDGSLRAIRLATEGHPGLVTALADMQRKFLAEATSPNRDLLSKSRRTEKEARSEWNDLVTSAANLVTANPSDDVTCDCFGQITAGIITTSPVGTVATSDGSSALAVEVKPLDTPSPKEQETAPQEAPSRLKDGATFILDLPEGIPTVWGIGDEVLWAHGEALMLVGPPGVGKTTLCGQVLRGRLGLGGDVLGMTVEAAQKRVLYLAMDRPQQIARSLRRTFTAADRPVLADKLRVWEGPPPGDVARNPEILLALANLAEADTVVIDSLKDAAVGLTEDEVAAGYNRARQTALAAGIQVLELHHLVKRGPNGSKPNTLADVYGSAWLTAGVGSVVLLWGAAGDPLVEFSHLKQPAAEVGPFKVQHDHGRGSSQVWHPTDLVTYAVAAGARGITAKQAAVALYEDENPKPNGVEKARRKLDSLAAQGLLLRAEKDGKTVWTTPAQGVTEILTGGHGPKTDTPHDAPHGGSRSEASSQVRGVTDALTGVTQPTTPGGSRTPPPVRGGVSPDPADDNEQISACIECGEVADGVHVTLRGGACSRCQW